MEAAPLPTPRRKAIYRAVKRGRLKPISLYPLTPEQALRAFLRTDPKKVWAAERKALMERRRKALKRRTPANE